VQGAAGQVCLTYLRDGVNEKGTKLEALCKRGRRFPGVMPIERKEEVAWDGDTKRRPGQRCKTPSLGRNRTA